MARRNAETGAGIGWARLDSNQLPPASEAYSHDRRVVGALVALGMGRRDAKTALRHVDRLAHAVAAGTITADTALVSMGLR